MFFFTGNGATRIQHRTYTLSLHDALPIFMPCANSKSYKKGDIVAVFLDLDKQGRMIARIGIKNYLARAPKSFGRKEFMEVDILPFERSTLGVGAIVDDKFLGIIYSSEIFTKIELHKKMKGYIKKVREDGKIDISITPIGEGRVSGEVESVLDVLKSRGGEIELNFDSLPESIKETFGISKKGFKRAIGVLKEGGRVELRDCQDAVGGKKIVLLK